MLNNTLKKNIHKTKVIKKIYFEDSLTQYIALSQGIYVTR